MEDEPLTRKVAEAAGLLRLSERKVRALIATGELPSVKIGGSRRVTSAQLDEFVRSLAAASDDSDD